MKMWKEILLNALTAAIGSFCGWFIIVVLLEKFNHYYLFIMPILIFIVIFLTFAILLWLKPEWRLFKTKVDGEVIEKEGVIE